jgi:hypothetical protein
VVGDGSMDQVSLCSEDHLLLLLLRAAAHAMAQVPSYCCQAPRLTAHGMAMPCAAL